MVTLFPGDKLVNENGKYYKITIEEITLDEIKRSLEEDERLKVKFEKQIMRTRGFLMSVEK